MTIYVDVSGRLVSYEGMAKEVIGSMLEEQGLSFEFIDEHTYLEKTAALKAAQGK